MEEFNTTFSQSAEVAEQQIVQAQESAVNNGYNKLSVIESELNTLYTGVGMRDISYSGLIELRGNDVLDFLNRISTNSIKNIVKGEIAKTIFCTEKGKIIDTAVVINLEDYQLLVCSQEHQEKMLIWLNKYVISDDVKLANINGKYTLLEVLGPQADSFMTLINGNIVNNIQPNSIKIINTEGIIFFLMKHYDASGQLIYWILADPVYAQKLIRYMVENKGPFDFNLIGDEAYNHYRIENGFPVAPNEINDLHNPHEVNLMNLVSTNKGCYIGQEVVARLETYDKVQKNYCGFVFASPVESDDKFILFDDNNAEAGKITSISYSYKFKKHIGIGLVKRNYFSDGVVLTAKNSIGNLIKVTVKKLPFKK
jgi:folate-binding protein YgfZ